jgi:hypothetical protein
MSLFKRTEADFAGTSYCCFCKHHILTPLGPLDLFHHWVEAHRAAMLATEPDLLTKQLEPSR